MLRDLDFEIEKLNRSNASPFIGMSPKDLGRYSLTKVIRSLENRDSLTGLELECHQEVSRRGAGSFSYGGGAAIPFDVLGTKVTRDMTVGTFGQGGGFVATEVSSDPIPLLRNKISAVRLGATVLTGLRGNLALPRQTSPSTPYSLPETGQVTASTPTIDQPILTPKRISVQVNYSRQLEIQSSVSVENWLRDDLFSQIAVYLDSMMLAGNGSNSQPLGILSTPGIGSITFGGPVSWGAILNFESALSNMNADVTGAKIAWVTTPQCRNKWKQTAQALIGATTVSARPIWEGMPQPDGSGDGIVNGYRAATSNNVPSNLAIYGNWPELILGIFGNGVEIINNPYTGAAQGEIQLFATIFADQLLKHSQSFCASVDPGNQ
jgi:HK97 family phage major capsid protein